MLFKKISLITFLFITTIIVNAQFTIQSDAFSNGGNIPAKYTAFNGLNINPPLSWSNAPTGTQSFLLIMFDRTFCSGRADTVCRSHWIVRDINATTNNIAEGSTSSGPLPVGAQLGKSDNAIHGIREYIGPFPDSTTVHLYEFKLYALNTSVINCVTPYYNYCMQKAIEGKVLGTASLFGYYLPRVGIPLPVIFVSVNAECDNKKVKIKWSTATESVDAEKFIIEKSVTGEQYTSIGTIPCTGNSNSLKEYSFIDNKNENTYYRIKQIDKNGKYTYSYVVFAKCNTTVPFITVAPNPSTDKFTLTFNSTSNKKITIQIYDASSKLVYYNQIVEQNRSISILTDKPAGIYLLKASNEKESIIEKLIKLK